jgi:hypothetical protein
MVVKQLRKAINWFNGRQAHEKAAPKVEEVESLEIPGGLAGIRERMAAMGHGPVNVPPKEYPSQQPPLHTEVSETENKPATKPKRKIRVPKPVGPTPIVEQKIDHVIKQPSTEQLPGPFS